MGDVEQDFAAVAAQINAKLKEAAEALKEANRLKDEANLSTMIMAEWVREDHYDDKEGLEELESRLELIDVSNLEDQLCQAGWSTSSSYC